MERDEKGRFVTRRPVPQEAVKAVCSTDKVEQVLEKLHSLALSGDTRAIDLYLAYTVGKPVPSTDAQSNLSWKQAVEQILNSDESDTGAD